MYYVYLLRSDKDKKFYIGYTSSLTLRFKEHSEGLVNSTKHRKPLQLVYYESYNSKDLATERETQLKKFGSAYASLLKRLGFK